MTTKGCGHCVGIDKIKNGLVFNEPISPYLSSAYGTIISIVNGLTIGAIFYIISQKKIINTSNFLTIDSWQCLLTFIAICNLWHAYTDHTRYLAWPIGFLDTLIPMTFSLVIANLAYSIGDILNFSFMFFILSFVGFLAYVNSAIKLTSKMSLNLYREHFKIQGHEFSNCIYKNVLNFERKAAGIYFILSIMCLLIYFLIYKINFAEYNNVRIVSIAACSCYSLTIVLLILNLNIRTQIRKIRCPKNRFSK